MYGNISKHVVNENIGHLAWQQCIEISLSMKIWRRNIESGVCYGVAAT